MPDRIVSAAEALRAQAAGIETALQEVRDQAARAEARTEHLETVVVPREEHRKRLLQLIGWSLAVLAVVIAAAVVTFDATLKRENADITRCFLSAGRVQPADIPYCEQRFPGYAEQQKRSAQTLAQFNELLKEIPRNRERIERLEDEVARLQGRPPPTTTSVPKHQEPS